MNRTPTLPYLVIISNIESTFFVTWFYYKVTYPTHYVKV
jgi:hypothetical protein